MRFNLSRFVEDPYNTERKHFCAHNSSFQNSYHKLSCAELKCTCQRDDSGVVLLYGVVHIKTSTTPHMTSFTESSYHSLE